MTVSTFELRQYEVSKAMTVARIAVRTTLIPMTFGTFEALGGRGGDTMGAGVGTRRAGAYKP